MNNLDTFVKKMYDLQYSDKEIVVSTQELKKIALDTGLSEQEWNESQIMLQNHIKNGKQHLSANNWDYAISEFEQAVNLNPFSAENNFNLAVAHHDKWKGEDDILALGNSQKYAEKSINIKAGYSPAIHLLAKIKKFSRQTKTENTKKKKTTLILAIAGIALFLIISLSSYISISNKVVKMNEEVTAKWAQVENVYQRRTDLIPQLVKTVESAAKYEKETLQLIIDARDEANNLNIDISDLDEEEIAKFQAKQDKVSAALNQFLIISEDYPELQAVQAYRDLQVQIEGTENRISVERRRFNEEVKEYNSYVKRFPQNMFGFEEKGYFKNK